MKHLCTKKRKNSANEVYIPLLSINFITGYLSVIEDTFLFHLWLKKDNYLKLDFKVQDNMVDSRAMNCVKYCVEILKTKIICGGNNQKAPKFHQMLHVCDYTKRHGCSMNHDGSRGEMYGKLKIKYDAKLTNK